RTAASTRCGRAAWTARRDCPWRTTRRWWSSTRASRRCCVSASAGTNTPANPSPSSATEMSLDCERQRVPQGDGRRLQSNWKRRGRKSGGYAGAIARLSATRKRTCDWSRT
ncbi:unnamed protein product, partial [Phaeothamnion confervicola]